MNRMRAIIGTEPRSGPLIAAMWIQLVLSVTSVLTLDYQTGTNVDGFRYVRLEEAHNLVFYALWLTVLLIPGFIVSIETLCLVTMAVLPVSAYTQFGASGLALDLPVQPLLLVLLVRGVIGGRMRGGWHIPWLLLLCTLVLISSAVSAEPAVSFRAAARFCLYVAAGVTAGCVAWRDLRLLRGCMALLFSGGLLTSVLVLMSALRVSDVNSLAVSFAMPFFQDRGSGAGFLTFSVLAAFALLQGVSERRLKWVIGLGVLLIATAILLSGTRAAYCGLAIVILVAPFVGTRFAGYSVAAALVFLLVFGTVTFDSRLLDSLTGRMERSIQYYDEQREGSITERFDLWHAAWRISNDHPLLGIGYDQFAHRGREFASVRMGVSVHNEYLKLAAETGWPCTLLWMGLIGSALLTVRSIAAIRGQVVRALFGAAWLCVVCYSVQGLFNNFQQISKIAFTYSFLIALLLGFRSGLRPRGSQ